VDRRQVFDLPEVTIKVTEHELIERECSCGYSSTSGISGGRADRV
jgi:transposase